MGGEITTSFDALAAAALTHYDLSPDATATLVNVSENHTYRVDDPASGRRHALRIHRPGYHTAQEIASELDWIEALRASGTIDSVAALADREGRRVVTVAAAGVGPHNVVLFEWLDGAPPDPDGDPVPGFRTLGALTARMHRQARAWRPPDGFARFRWDYETSIGAAGHWGRWQDGLGLGVEERRILGRLDTTIERRLRAYGQSPARFGLAHCDLRLANLLVEGERVRVLDFDDCGFGWFMYDFAAAVSFIEDHPVVPALQAAWLEGYRSVAPLAAADEAELATFVLLRRLLLVAWIGSHHTFAPEAREFGAGFTEGTCVLAEQYLSDHV
ncbi:MAG: aminoglycoside phosphotransferase [Thermoleophilia bacterium]|nr:aminoglycoside phosphotransferase [Thermoleophilia bacterium]